jgi:aryl-alcohol dehydrogenase-like predicted oxidoreductase
MTAAGPQRLALGTVQLGLPYGVANGTGQVPAAEAARIVERARVAGVDTLDTAVAYGDSQRRLGEIGIAGWRVVSKLPPLPAEERDVAGWVERCVAQSLAALNVTSLHGLLLHRAADALTDRGPALRAALERLKARNVVRKIGVSIYDPAVLGDVQARFPLDLLQAPFSILDRRLETSGWLERLMRDGAELHVRSVFLQGLLLMSQRERPAKFGRWSALWRAWHAWLERESLSPAEACLGFVLAYEDIDRVIVGVDNSAQLSELLAAAVPRALVPPPEFSTGDVELLDPSSWSRL